MDAGTLTLGERRIDISNVEKTFFPDAGLTKGDLLDHYDGVAELLLGHVAGRPFAFRRFPDGIDGDGFFQKKVPDHAPAWLPRVDVPLREGGAKPHVVLERRADLLWVVDQGTIEPHPWLSPADDLDRPVEAVVDLDPPPGSDAGEARWATRRVRDLLDELDVPCRLKTSGSKGYHVHVLLRGGEDFATVRSAMQRIAALLARRHPDRLTDASRLAKREGRVYVDVARNAYGQTAIAPYAVRALPGAPVATPLDWDELGGVDPQRYDIRSVRRRLAQRDDPWTEAVAPTRPGDLVARLDELEQELERGA